MAKHVSGPLGSRTQKPHAKDGWTHDRGDKANDTPSGKLPPRGTVRYEYVRGEKK